MRSTRHILVVWLALAWGFGGWANAEGIVLPDGPQLRDHPVPVSLDTQIPPEAKLIGPGWTLAPGLNSFRVGDQFLVLAAAPGTYTIRYQIYWIHTEPVTLYDKTGKEITVLSFLGAGSVDDTATLTITGDPGPNPPLPPTPGGPYQLMFFFDGDQLDNLPRDQRSILTSLAIRQKLTASGHSFLEVLEDDSFAGSVPEKYRPWIDAVRNDQMPRVAIAPIKGGTIRDYLLPENEAELMKLLEAAP